MKSNKFYSVSKFIQENGEKLLEDFLKVFLKTNYGGWFFGKIIDVGVEMLSDRIIDPLTDVLVIRISKKFDVERAKRMVNRMELAKERGDENGYYDSVDDLLGGL